MPPMAPAPKRRRRLLPILLSLLVLLLAAGAATYLFSRHHNSKKISAQTAASVTLYYNDGKTVLWRSKDQQTAAPYFVELARAELSKRYGNNYANQGAWSVTTTLDASLQAKAEQLVQDNQANLKSATQGAADEEATILQDVRTGQIKALVGGVDYTDKDHGKINFADTPLEAGSSIKPVDYAAQIEGTTNTGAGTAVADTQVALPGYICTNKATPQAGGNCLADYDFQYPGQIPLRYALGGNRNVPAVEAALAAIPNDKSPNQVDSLNKVLKLIKSMGADKGYNCYEGQATTQPVQCYEAAMLGDGAYVTLADELHVLATFANNGARVPQTTIYSVKLNGNTKTAWHAPQSQQVIKKDTAYIINDIMSDPNASYLPGSCDADDCSADANSYKFQRYDGWKFAVDNGTVNDSNSGNMASWSSQYAVISWVGNHARNQKLNTSVEQLTTPLTKGLMQAAHDNKTADNWKQPSDIKVAPAFVLNNHLHYGDVEPSPSTDLYPNWYK